MSKEQALPNPETMGYEAAKEELKVIVQTLETGSAPLEQTLELWQRGEALARRCRSILESATKQVQSATADSAPVTPAEGE